MKIMKIQEFRDRFTNIMKVLVFHWRIMKLIQKKFHLRIIKKIKILEFKMREKQKS